MVVLVPLLGKVIRSRMCPTTSSERRSTGVRNVSERLNAFMVRSKHSRTLDGHRAMTGWSPWVPQRACMTSPWETWVGSPVEGPARMTSTRTKGISAMHPKPMPSCMRLKPGPLVAVRARAPARLAPMMALMLAISSSIWMYPPPERGSWRARISATSVDGVMGYPA
jgi:hypothetical protein